jgi:hypothetical protein
MMATSCLILKALLARPILHLVIRTESLGEGAAKVSSLFISNVYSIHVLSYVSLRSMSQKQVQV